MSGDGSQLTGYRVSSSLDSHSAPAQSISAYPGETITRSLSMLGDDDTPASSEQAIRTRRRNYRSVEERNRQSPADPTLRDEIRRGVMRAIEVAKEMAEAAKSGDLMELSNAGFELGRCLERLWEFRHARESNWGDLVNLIQGSLIREKFESFSESQCRFICDIFSYHLRPSPVEDDDLRSSVRIIRRAGLDPWKGLSDAKDD